MRRTDPVAAVFADLERPALPQPEFAQSLRDTLLAELATAPVAVPTPRRGRARPRFRFPPGVRPALVVVAALMLCGIATATYLATRSGPRAERPVYGNGPLTFTAGGAITAVDPSGRLRPVWRCRQPHGCGILSSIAWSRDGRWLAYAEPQWGRPNPAAGLHVVDTRTRHERFLPFNKPGCKIPYDLTWSPDGKRLVYACPSRIYLIDRDLTSPTLLNTGTNGHGHLSSPTWSRDGSRLAFAYHQGAFGRGSSAVYLVDSDGTHRRLLSKSAAAPAWSPDGSVIAVRAGCGGIKLFTPAGHDVTPLMADRSGCRAIGVPGVPIWSPDGRKLAIQMRPRGGVYLINRDGSHRHVIVRKGSPADSGGGAFGVDRPAWRPVPTTGKHKPSGGAPL